MPARRYLDVAQRVGLTTLYAKLWGSITTPHSTGTVQGTSVGAGYYDFAGLDDNLYYTVQEEVEAGTKAATDPILSVMNPDFLSLLEGIDAKTQLIGTGAATIAVPVSEGGLLNELVIGDDYSENNGRQLSWTVDLPTGATVGVATCFFGGEHTDPNLADANRWIVEGSLTAGPIAGRCVISFNWARSINQHLEPGQYNWSAEIRNDTGLQSTRVMSKKTRRVTLVEKQTNA
jgi:hypothetical protein